MANASKSVVKTYTEVPGVTLELSEDEAYTLAAILCTIGGSPESPRGQAQAVLDALVSAGFDWDDVRCVAIRKRYTGNGMFRTKP